MVDKIALVDIDGCLVQGGKLNMALVQRLKSGGYNQIVLFTQRSQFMMYEKLSEGSPSETALFFTPDIVQALEAQGLSVKVSTSVDHYLGEPLQYYDEQLSGFERQYQQFLMGCNPNSGWPLTDEQNSQLCDLYKQILIELQHIAKGIGEQDIQVIAEKAAAADGGLEQAKQDFTTVLESIADASVKDLANDALELESLIRQWQVFHPRTKVAQKQALDKLFPAAQIDYFDDYVENIAEIHQANPERAPNSFVVQGGFMVPLEVYRAKGFANNQDGRKALKAALAFDDDTFTAQDIVAYLSNKNPNIQAFGRQLMAEAKAVDVFVKEKTKLIATPKFAQKFQHDPRFKEGLSVDFERYCLTQKLGVLQAIVDPADLLERYHVSRPEHFYQQYLLTKAKQVVDHTPDEQLRFDTQARVLTEVTLTEKDYQIIYERICEARGEVALVEPNYQQALEKLLGLTKPLSTTTLCNIDIRKEPALLKKFQAWLCTVDTPCAAPTTFRTSSVAGYDLVDGVDPIDSEADKQNTRKIALTACSRLLLQGDNLAQMGSINALQEEMEMHISLALEVHCKAFEAQYPPGNANAVPGMLWDRAREKAMIAMTQTVRTTFQDALLASRKNDAIDFVTLNDHLDKARKRLKGSCQEAFVKACVFTVPDFKLRCQEPKIAKAISGKAYAATSIRRDYFTSSATGLNTRIQGSDNTSHHKEAGLGHQAMRLRVHSDGSVMMRLPSIPEVDIKYTRRLSAWAKAVGVSFCNMALSAANGFIGAFNHFANENKQITPYEKIIGPWQAKLNDAALKIEEAADALRAKLGGYSGPVILNRETSIPNAFMDNHMFGANRQGLRIEIEIKAIHQVNAKRQDRSLIFIQGIPVNQHTQNLSYQSSGVLKEATLMAEMAMLANLCQQLPESISQFEYESVLQQYRKFLEQQPFSSNSFFCDSAHGQAAIEALTELKKGLSARLQYSPLEPSQDLKVMVNQALLQVFSHNLHMDQRYGMLIQALSTYGQAATMAGCKSANERFAEVEGRADLLRQLNLEPCALPQVKQAMLAALQAFQEDPAKIDALVDCMDKCFNEYTLQERSSAAVSLLDQGAASKVGAFEKSRFGRTFQFDTNRAENEAVDRLKTKGTSALQAHSKKSDHAQEIKKKTQCFDGRRNFEACTAEIQVLHQFLINKLATVSKLDKSKVREIIDLMEDPFVALSNTKLLAQLVSSGVLAKCSEPELELIGVSFTSKDDFVNTGSANMTADVYEFERADQFDLMVDPEVSRAHPERLGSKETARFKRYVDVGSQSADLYGDRDGGTLKSLRDFFDPTRLHDPAYVAHRSEALEMVLDQDQKQKLYQLCTTPPSETVSQALSSVSNEHEAKPTLGEKLAMATLKYGALAATIATFVLSKGAM